MKFARITHFLFIACLLAAVTACQTTGPKGPSEKTAESAASKDEFIIAAMEYERLAATTNDPKQSILYQLKAIELLIKAGQTPAAKAKLAGINTASLDSNLLARKRVLEAQVATAEGNHRYAIDLLQKTRQMRGINPTIIAEIYWARSQAEASAGNTMLAVKSLIAREKYIANEDTVEENHLHIWKLISTLPQQQINAEYRATTDPILRGWLSLTTLIRQHRQDKKALYSAFEGWKQTYANHPFKEDLLALLISPEQEFIGRVESIALLLPLSPANSPLAKIAEAFKDGFMAMNVYSKDPYKPTIRLYDYGDNLTQAIPYYELARQEGASLIVGPFGKDAVDALVKGQRKFIPTLLLGHTDEAVRARVPVFQFGLAPEQEARQTAERAYLDGHRHAAVMYPANTLGQRMRDAFVEHWQNLGGIVLTEQSYNESQHDHSHVITQLLDIDESVARKRRLEVVLKTGLEFEPRRREDIDFLFLVADPTPGRNIKPQLNFYQALHLPVYSTSHIYLGAKPDKLNDNDLSGVMFADMPWILINDGQIAELRGILQQQTPHYFQTPLDRFYALGVDSYAIIPHLDRLASAQGERFAGVTSALSMDQFARIRRQLLWAQFRSGYARQLDTFLGLSPEFEDVRY